MLDITGNSALDVLIGMSFFFFLLSLVCSAVNEGIATAFNLRAKDLERGVRQLLDDPAKAREFYAHWRVQALFKPARFLGAGGKGPFSDKRPSYIPSRVFALTVLDTFAPPTNADSHDLLARANAALATGGHNSTVKGLLQDAVDEAGNDVEKFRQALERSFNEVMERASGWYKRRVQLILFAIALVLVGAMNADSFTVAQRLWKDDALRAAVVGQARSATSATDCSQGSSGAQDQTPADAAAACVDRVKQLGIPLGWSKATSPSGWERALAKALGLLVTAFALLLGAPFWFDMLGRVAKLRGSGPSPTATPPDKAQPPVQVVVTPPNGGGTT